VNGVQESLGRAKQMLKKPEFWDGRTAGRIVDAIASQS
jgi:hypothetical protein